MFKLGFALAVLGLLACGGPQGTSSESESGTKMAAEGGASPEESDVASPPGDTAPAGSQAGAADEDKGSEDADDSGDEAAPE